MTDKEQLLARLAEEPDMVIATAYVYAVNMCKFGKDVTEKWLTATAQSIALNDAYVRGCVETENRIYNDMQMMKEGKTICSTNKDS